MKSIYFRKGLVFVMLIGFISCKIDQKNNKKLLSESAHIIKSYQDSISSSNSTDISRRYRDSVYRKIIDSYIGDHKFKDFANIVFNTSKLQKPLFIEVTSSTCPPCKSQIPALNKIVEKYKDSVDFVLLFGDNTQKVKQLSSMYNDEIELIPNRGSYKQPLNFSGFKHGMGYPSKYYIDVNKKIVHYSSGAMMPNGSIITRDSLGRIIKETLVTEKIADSMNFAKLEAEIQYLLTQNRFLPSQE
ncbi:TlpA family protein disulfide reductase [Seonamhaeicola marinus]|uniref:Thioredoxin family protein n=1 Tax=Seonamhaeicola marinus TaxID=1912246 RepID=A0A5D0H8I5_9FLAO|nr:thioredoxin family protein [Seonamhaeicola marinus]TYA65932.1 thioredoxin family protein [Seonamhaeicola marinus]